MRRAAVAEVAGVGVLADKVDQPCPAEVVCELPGRGLVEPHQGLVQLEIFCHAEIEGSLQCLDRLVAAIGNRCAQKLGAAPLSRQRVVAGGGGGAVHGHGGAATPSQTREALQKHEGRSFRIAPYRLVLRLQFQRAPHVRKVNNAPEINVSLKVVHHLELYRRE